MVMGQLQPLLKALHANRVGGAVTFTLLTTNFELVLLLFINVAYNGKLVRGLCMFSARCSAQCDVWNNLGKTP